MNDFTRILSERDLRSDGFADEVARIVSEHPALLPDLIAALRSSDPATRGHAADALEKVARQLPGEVLAFLPHIIDSALNDRVAMVRWHLAMVLGHLSIASDDVSSSMQALFTLLGDDSAFVKSWAITSLCIVARIAPGQTESILNKIAPLVSDPGPAVSKRARTALRVLSNPGTPLPGTWVKSSHIHNI